MSSGGPLIKNLFFPRALNLSELFTEYTHRLRQFSLKHEAKDIECCETYLNMKGPKLGVRVPKICFPTSMVRISEWCQNSGETCPYRLR